ncbi:unnamed protein product [Darwinula stevensoni]|uniref:Peptidase S1 domain-containing protein n=1 Tax=Darwinula stevensoni TaxID=69355 RepID=A0A7R9FPA7_9CRUS|nr:unnamed protein product [Darwinula stevensoni]CAG0897363.1 unnamed protein product [Darwinula stevensoni]
MVFVLGWMWMAFLSFDWTELRRVIAVTGSCDISHWETLLPIAVHGRDFETNGLESNKTRQDGRIDGGRDDSIENYPWLVSVQYRTGDRKHFCGGSILDTRHVITSAQCCGEHTLDGIQIRAGSNYTDKNGTLRYVSRIRKHPDFDM